MHIVVMINLVENGIQAQYGLPGKHLIQLQIEIQLENYSGLA